MPRSKIEVYWNTAETAPVGVIAQIRVTDGCGADYLVPYPGKLTREGWVNATSGKPLSVSVTYWKPYVETLAKKKKAERSRTIILPQTDGRSGLTRLRVSRRL
jgi:hypothetical protein